MIWIKSFALGVATMLVGSFATLIAFTIYIGRQTRGEHATVGFDPVSLDISTALIVCIGWFLTGAGFTYWFLRRHHNRSSVTQRLQ